MTTLPVGHLQKAGSSAALWVRWVTANAVSESVGLGITLGATGYLFSRLESLPLVAAGLLSLLGAVVAGTIEATLVGLAQWWAMRPWFSDIERFTWWRATLIGALLGYVLGYMPSTVIGMLPPSGAAAEPIAEPSITITLLLAACLGMVAGAILSFAQFLVLRRHVAHAGWWMPANMLAWSVGMPLIFLAIDLAVRMAHLWQSFVIMIGALFITGAIVGAIHGLVLVRLAKVDQAN